MTELFAMGAAGNQGAGQGGIAGMLTGFLPFIVIILIFYFLIIRPQQKRQKEHKELLESLAKNDKVFTSSGIYGTILNLDENKVILKISEVKGEAVKVEVMRSTISGKAQ